MRRCFATGCCENQERGAQASQPAVLRCGPHGRAHHFAVIFRRSTLPEAGTSQLSWPEKPATGLFSLPDRKSAVLGKSVSVRVFLGGRRIRKKKNAEKTEYNLT